MKKTPKEIRLENDPNYVDKFLPGRELKAELPEIFEESELDELFGEIEDFGMYRVFYNKNHLEDGPAYYVSLDPGFYIGFEAEFNGLNREKCERGIPYLKKKCYSFIFLDLDTEKNRAKVILWVSGESFEEANEKLDEVIDELRSWDDNDNIVLGLNNRIFVDQNMEAYKLEEV